MTVSGGGQSKEMFVSQINDFSLYVIVLFLGSEKEMELHFPKQGVIWDVWFFPRSIASPLSLLSPPAPTYQNVLPAGVIRKH